MRWTILIAVVIVVWLLGFGLMQLRRLAQITLRKGERALLQARGVTARINCDRALAPGLRTHVTNQREVVLMLTDQRLAVATWRGVLVDLGPGDALRVTAPGPKRLVLEGERRARSPADKPTQVRLELLVDQPERWVEGIEGLLKPA
jgi:hypothetical protein